MRIGIAGAGSIGLATAAWLASAGHEVVIWSPRMSHAMAGQTAPLHSEGVVEADVPVTFVATAAALAERCGVVVIALPVNGHRAVMDALIPALQHGAMLIVSSMASLSALYLFEKARSAGKTISVASFGTTTLTARRTGPAAVRVMTRRTRLGLSVLPASRREEATALCRSLFGDVFNADENVLASALVNINPVAHAPLALFNWTRIERAESWPQYHFMTPDVAGVILKLDRERRETGAGYGLAVRGIEEHFGASFGTTATNLAAIAAELHAKRGGPPGPTDTGTRFLHEDVPFGLVFTQEAARIAGIPVPATTAVIAMAELLTGASYEAANDLIGPLGLANETHAGLLERVNT